MLGIMPLVDVWEELQARVEQLAGEAAQRVGPLHRPAPPAGALRWGREPGPVGL
jgi:hypothetical protein